MRRPTGILPGRYVFQTPPPAVEASILSAAVAEGDGEAPGADGEAAAPVGGVVAAGVAVGFGGGEFWATIVGVRAGVGEGVGVAFWFFLFPFVCLLGGADGLGAGGGVTTATFGGSACVAGSTRINSFAAGGGGVGATPAMLSGLFGAVCSR